MPSVFAMVIHRSAVAACAALLITGLALPAQAKQTGAPFIGWRQTNTASFDEFRGLAAVSASVAWVSGESGTILRTTDGGTSWQNVSFPEGAGRAFRDIEAFDADHAVVLSIGLGKRSTIYATSDGGATWHNTFTNRNGNAFYDCMAFSNDGTGLAMSDPVNGRFRLVISHDWGLSWRLLIPQQMPPALDGEFAFAASGTCLVSGPSHQFWMASGGTAHPRVFHTWDAGNTWTVSSTPLRGGPTAGIYSIDFRNGRDGVAVGGDFADPTDGSAAAGVTADGGQSYTLSSPQVYGYRSGVAYVTAKLVVAVGPTGSDVSRSGGARWHHFDNDRYDSIDCAADGACWGSGTEGRVSVLLR